MSAEGIQVHAEPPTYPTLAEIERYASDARTAGRAKALAHLRNGSPAQAFVALVEATEAEARIFGFTGTVIPAGPGVPLPCHPRPAAAHPTDGVVVTCVVAGCLRPIRNKMRRLCDAHYQRYLKYGDPVGGKWHTFTRTTPAKDRLSARLVEQENGCWHWTGVVDADGYGRVGYKGRRSETVQRAVYDCFVGPIPDGMAVDHVCHTNATGCPGGKQCLHRRCGNPQHLELVTLAENTRRNNNSTKNQCKNGHPYTPENTYRSAGRRYCITCRVDNTGHPPVKAVAS